MKRFLKAVFCIIVFTLSFSCYATSTVLSPAEQLAELLGQYQNMTAHFSQTVADSKGRPIQQTAGNMALQRPENLRWETQQPTEQLILTDGKTLWVYDKDLQQVTISPLQKKTGTTPAMLMTTSAKDLQVNYQVSTSTDAKSQQVFQLIPNMKNSDFQWVRFFFSQNQIIKMQIQDNIGQITSITFTQINKNSKLSKAVFILKTPKDVDVVRE